METASTDSARVIRIRHRKYRACFSVLRKARSNQFSKLKWIRTMSASDDEVRTLQ